MHTGAVAPNASGGGGASVPSVHPPVAPKPSKWEQLCKMTDGDKNGSGGNSSGSTASNPYGVQYFPPGYASAVGSDYGSEPARSTTGSVNPPSRLPKKSSWDALKQMAEKEGSQYSASESNI
jgi:hypothetical protein